jgi:hypothetical protein
VPKPVDKRLHNFAKAYGDWAGVMRLKIALDGYGLTRKE